MSKRPRVDFQALIQSDLAHAVATSAIPSTDQAPPPRAVVASESTPRHPVTANKQGTLKERTRQQSLYLEIPVHEALREIAFTERVSLHALFLEGIDAVLKKRGSPSITELLRAAAKPVL